jgi:hypothetical protein
MCAVFTFVDDFFSAGSLQHATEAQEHVHVAIRGTLGYDGLSVKKNVFAQTAEILGFLVDFPAGTIQPKTGAIEKMFFVLFKIDARAPQKLRYWQCLSSLVTMYSPVLHGMRPFIAQINAMTSKATQYQTAHAMPSSALFDIEIWRAAIIMVLMNPPALAVPLHMFIKNPRNRNPHPTVSDASPWRLCAALYCAQTGDSSHDKRSELITYLTQFENGGPFPADIAIRIESVCGKSRHAVMPQLRAHIHTILE